MRGRIVTVLAAGAAVLAGSGVQAQQPSAPDLNAIPDKMPFSTPYGAPINAQQAQALIQAGAAEASKKGWPEDIAVYDSGANLVAFLRMDGAQLGSIAIAEHKARAAVKFRRPTRAFEDAVQKLGLNYILSLDDAIASRGGIPIVVDGKIIGGIGCSGGTASQDEEICTVAAGTLNK